MPSLMRLSLAGFADGVDSAPEAAAAAAQAAVAKKVLRVSFMVLVLLFNQRMVRRPSKTGGVLCAPNAHFPGLRLLSKKRLMCPQGN